MALLCDISRNDIVELDFCVFIADVEYCPKVFWYWWRPKDCVHIASTGLCCLQTGTSLPNLTRGSEQFVCLSVCTSCLITHPSIRMIVGGKSQKGYSSFVARRYSLSSRMNQRCASGCLYREHWLPIRSRMRPSHTSSLVR